ncbi:UDP-glucuronosyltransferase 2B2-like [Spodoptera litura]|uniref:UDP-glucuronosyltransferase n=1 Tax=Spodoptera litura TaxID=69820 RepID=A0A9J7DVA5_SPOLT|nr:UDP-glucuronosyltransferase 2B2-like [Spodoptera litura]
MKLSILLLLGVVAHCHGYHIITMFPMPSHSHNQLSKGIVDALLQGGHTVTWVTPFPGKADKNNPKLKLIDISSVLSHVSNIDMTDQSYNNAGISFIKEFAANMSLEMLNTPAVKEALMKGNFDAVVTENFFCDFLAGIPAVLQVPWIQLAATQLHPDIEAQVDEVRSVPTIPLMFNPSGVPMTFASRAINAMIFSMMTIYRWTGRATTIKQYEDFFTPIAAARGVSLPPFDDAFHNVSITFVNSHESLTPAFTTPPNVISIAGYHMDENIPPLPKDLQELLDGSPKGVIYFSMGSVLRSSALKPHTRAALLKLFASLPYTVLWKFEEPLKDLPPNVHVRPWMPQPSILAHPNVKVFITHGGQLSSLEAVRAGVPLLAVPVFGDQPANAERARRSGYALKVDFSPDMVPELEVALKEILNNDQYSKRVKYLSKLFTNRPTTPKKLINHYVELAIETKGALHLRSTSLQYRWYERWMLDVVLVLLVTLASILALLVFAVKKAINKVTGKKVYTEKSSKKKRN